MKKSLLLTFLLISFVQISNAQFLWYENQTNTNKIKYESASDGTFLTAVTNPNTTGINTNSTVSQFNRNVGEKAFLKFKLYNPVTDFTNYTVTVKAYINIPTAALTSSNSRLRLYFSNSTANGILFKQLFFTVGQQWQSFTFNFDGTTIPQTVLDANGYDLVQIGFANTNISEPAVTYYIDSISGTTEQVVPVVVRPADWLAGSWGITFPIYGGKRLDSEVAGGYNYRAGAQQIVDELPGAGHVIIGLSNFANSTIFTIRGNANVDIAAEIDESFLPSQVNEAILFDVMQKFKDAGKKIILYISTDYFDDADAATQAKWTTYYTNKFGGNEYLAYKNLIEGFIVRVKDYADGYWLDTTAPLDDDGHMADFVQMVRDADPVCAISAQPNGAYFLDNKGAFIKVDSDGTNDTDPSDYKIVSFEAVNTYQDYTSGHVTPLGQGAPPNSWAYEEFSIPAMVANPWSTYQNNTVLRHAWFPMRDKWHVSSANLIFGTEDAYRFAKTLVDAKCGVTFATTVDDIKSGKGFMMAEEMAIMKTINDRLLSNPAPNPVPYARPAGAYLVGESLSTGSFTKDEVKFYPNPVINGLTITRSSSERNQVKVISLLGATVFETIWDDNSLSKQFDLTHLNSGIYLVNLSNGNNESITQKIIISK
nr:hypothetical protein [uncultured bacterium]